MKTSLGLFTRILGFLCVWSTYSPNALAGVFSYRIHQFQPTFAGCDTFKADIVARFEAATGARVLSNACELLPNGGADFVIDYARDTEANLVSNYFPQSDDLGLYQTRGQCLEYLAADADDFRDATGLEPVTAYCYQNVHQEGEEKTWTTRIDGFGEPRERPLSLRRYFYDAASFNPEALATQITTALTASGASHARANAFTRGGRTSIVATYYAPKRIPIETYDEGSFPSLEACESHRNTFDGIYNAAGGQLAAYLCLVDPYSRIISFYAAGTKQRNIDTNHTSIAYPTYADCESKRAQTESDWRGSGGLNVIGSLCASTEWITGRTIKMQLFWLE